MLFILILSTYFIAIETDGNGKVLIKSRSPAAYVWNELQKMQTDVIIDVWSAPRMSNGSFTILIGSSDLEKLNFQYEVLIENPERLGVANQQHHRITKRSSFYLFQYNSYSEIQDYLYSLPKQYPGLVEIFNMTEKSIEGRAMTYVKIGQSQKHRKPALYIDAGTHAREWITIAVALYGIDMLLTSRSRNVRDLLTAIDFYIVPMVNPDGYEYSRTQDRYWRKNRAENWDPDCPGVDLNRNFGWFFGTADSAKWSCQTNYAGQRAFSEPETQAVRGLVYELEDRLKAFVSLHNYGQIWLYPFSNRVNYYPDNKADLIRVAKAGIKAMEQETGAIFITNTGANEFYEASGNSHDWAKGKMNVDYSYIIELQPGGFNGVSMNGFLVSESKIATAGRETWAGLLVVAEEVKKRY